MESSFENPRHRLTGEPSSATSLFTGRQGTSKRSTPQFAFHDTAAIPSSQSIPLLSHQKDQPDNFSVSGEMTTRLSNLSRITNHDQKKQSTEEESQPSSMTIGELDPDLERVMSRLCHHSRANEENKKQIKLLKTGVEKLIKLSIENDEIDDEDTADLLHSVLSNTKAGLMVIADRLDNLSIPEENKNYLYSLARLQLEFYFTDLSFPIFDLITFILEGTQQPPAKAGGLAIRTESPDTRQRRVMIQS